MQGYKITPITLAGKLVYNSCSESGSVGVTGSMTSCTVEEGWKLTATMECENYLNLHNGSSIMGKMWDRKLFLHINGVPPCLKYYFL